MTLIFNSSKTLMIAACAKTHLNEKENYLDHSQSSYFTSVKNPYISRKIFQEQRGNVISIEE